MESDANGFDMLDIAAKTAVASCCSNVAAATSREVAQRDERDRPPPCVAQNTSQRQPRRDSDSDRRPSCYSFAGVVVDASSLHLVFEPIRRVCDLCFVRLAVAATTVMTVARYFPCL